MTGHLPKFPKARAALLVAAWLMAVGAMAGLLARSQLHSQDAINERFDLRAEIAARFVTTYVDDLVERQRDVANRRLSGATVSEEVFQRAVGDGGYEAAVLLDARGRLLRVAPPRRTLLGHDMAARYDHLRRGVAGETAVSEVVPSAADGIPIVAFAVPFHSRHGRRVYSAAYDISNTPLGAYLRNAIQVRPNQVYLVDRTGNVVARNGRTLPGVTRLDSLEPDLAGALTEAPEGSYDDSNGRAQRFASRKVPGTPWRVVVAVPTDLLYASIGGVGRWLPWLAVVGFALGGLLVLLLLLRLMQSRSRLEAANVALDKLSRIDALTGLHNRRHIEEVLDALVSAGRRHDHVRFAVLLVDIDHFKEINDTHGHHAGDEVLRATAANLASIVRMEDSLARWGGEEFLIALPSVEVDGAIAAAERVRQGVGGAPLRMPDGEAVRVKVTVGVAVWDGESAEGLLRRADAALYRGKQKGRDRVEAADRAPVPARG